MHPEKVKRLILLAPAGLGISEAWLPRKLSTIPFVGEWFAFGLGTWLFRRSLADEENLVSAVPNIGHRIADETKFRGYASAVLSSQRGLLREDLFEDHLEIAVEGVPVLGIWGEKDAVIPLSGMGRLAQANREVEQVMIRAAGHGLAYMHPREVLEAIRSFLGRS